MAQFHSNFELNFHKHVSSALLMFSVRWPNHMWTDPCHIFRLARIKGTQPILLEFHIIWKIPNNMCISLGRIGVGFGKKKIITCWYWHILFLLWESADMAISLFLSSCCWKVNHLGLVHNSFTWRVLCINVNFLNYHPLHLFSSIVGIYLILRFWFVFFGAFFEFSRMLY